MNSFLYRKILTPRKLKLDYISPPICEGEFSASGTSEISLQPIYRRRGPTGLIMEWQGTYWRLRWNSYPGALCYSVYKLSFSDYILVAECIDDTFIDLDVFGNGTYIVTVITNDGESDPSDPIVTPDAPIPPIPPVVPCTGTGTPVPEDFLVELVPAEELQTFSVNSDEMLSDPAWDWGGKTGRFELRWISGHVSASCPAFQERSNGNFFGEEHYGWGDDPMWWTDPFTSGPTTAIQTYGCQWPPGGSCNVETSILADRPDGVFLWKIVSPQTRETWVAMGLINQEIFWAGTVNAASCGGPCTCNNDGADPLIYKVYRTHEFVAQPATTTIQNLLVQAHLIDGSSEAWCGGAFAAWTGLVNGTVSYNENQWNNTLLDPFVMIGQSLVTMVIINGVGGSPGYWSLEIYGQRCVGGVPQDYLIYEGQKLYGNTPLGDYYKVSAANPSCPACLTIV